MTSIVFSRPFSSGSSGLQQIPSVNVSSINDAPDNTSTIAQVNTSTISGVKWIYTITDSTDSLYSTGEVLARDTGNDPDYTVYALQGNLSLYDLDVISDGTTMSLQITNYGLNVIVVSAVQIVVAE